MSTLLGDAARTMIKRVRGDHVLRRSERGVARHLTSAHEAIRADLVALSAQLDDRGPIGKNSTEKPAAPAGPFAAAEPAVRALFDDPQPQLVPEAVRFVTERLTPEMTVLEWGGGASTPYLAARVGVLHTVEASPRWAMVLLDYMQHRLDLVDRWRLHYVGANWTSVRAARRRTGRPLPEPVARRQLEDDYALTITGPVDAIVIDGAVRQATVAKAAEYVQRDRPGLIVVNGMDTQYVAEAVQEIELDGYDRQNFWGTLVGLDGDSIARCTTVWVRREGPAADEPAPGEDAASY